MNRYRCLLDTSALLAHYRKEAGWEAVQSLLEADDVELMTASVCMTELARRALAVGATEEEATSVMDSYEALVDVVVPIDARVAREAFAIACLVPGRLPLVDAIIAAAARTQDAVLVHRDSHFQMVPTDTLATRHLSQAQG